MTSHRRHLRALLAGLAALSLSTLAACANYSQPAASPSPTGSTSGSAQTVSLVTPGKLTVCTHLAYKPFQFKDKDNKTVGFDVDLMDLVAKKLGVTQEIFDIAFEQITSGAVFAAKKCDAAAAAITIRADRQKAASFSDPYFSATQALLVSTDSTITDLPDLKGKMLAVQDATTGQDYGKDNAAANGYTVKVFDDFPSGANAVLAKTVAAAINDNGVVYNFAAENPGTKVVKEFNTHEKYGFSMGKDNAALLAVVNDVLKTAKADGSYNAIYQKWFGKDAPKD
ncbi:MAG: transporter substrate-binding domain-containing protein [Micropruina sp.]|uniref:transporter substrate-binding domain-containing protein n=1 Tax=Micropruina sp. TaxID=2737536 RepID=UPI0039E4A6B9